MGYLDYAGLDEIDVIELQLDIIPIKRNNFLPNEYLDIFHINYNVEKNDYEKNKNKIHKEIAYRLQFGGIERPKKVLEADILIMIERNTKKVIDILIPGFINKSELKNLYEIDNPDYLYFKIKQLLEE